MKLGDIRLKSPFSTRAPTLREAMSLYNVQLCDILLLDDDVYSYGSVTGKCCPINIGDCVKYSDNDQVLADN